MGGLGENVKNGSGFLFFFFFGNNGSGFLDFRVLGFSLKDL